jgi:hypothetical protein
MGVIIEPNITVDNIIITKDANDEYGTERLLNEWGRTVPIIKIGDYVLNSAEIMSFDLFVNFNSLPRFELSVNDENYQIREVLKNDIDTAIIFIGYKDWYIKFNALIENNSSDIGGIIIDISGIFYVPELYNKEQKAYTSMTVVDILKDICSSCKLGLFTIDNTDLNREISEINTEKTRLSFLKNIIETKTTNIYCFDTFGYLHIGNIDKIKEQNISKYSLTPMRGESIEPTDIILTSIGKEFTEGDNENKIPVLYYTLKSNFSKLITNTYKEYGIKYSNGELGYNEDSDKNVLIGNNFDNTFSGFKNANFPFYKEVINKKIIGNVISIELEHLIFELTPFDIVYFECYLPAKADKPSRLDEEHSGKKMVLSYSLHYKQTNDEFNRITQVINLI